MSGFWAAVGALAPPVGVGLVFWLVMRWIVQADRRERAAQASLDARQETSLVTQDASPARPGPEGPATLAPAAGGRDADAAPGSAQGPDHGGDASSAGRGSAPEAGSPPASDAGSEPRPTRADRDSSAPHDGGDELA